MISRRRIFTMAVIAQLAGWPVAFAAMPHACVWKVTAPGGGILYLGGSIHALHPTDYPLPAAYNRAFEAADRLIFEVDHDALRASSRRIEKAARYARGDGLKNHVDPRTYAYVRRVFGILKVPEEKFASYKPWFLALILQTPQLHAYPRIWCGRLF